MTPDDTRAPRYDDDPRAEPRVVERQNETIIQKPIFVPDDVLKNILRNEKPKYRLPN